jgi:hypothetical protein
MIVADTAGQVINSPIVVAIVSVAATAFVALAVAAMRMVIELAKMQTELTEIRAAIVEIKSDPDVMRWSNYGRATRALEVNPSGPVIQQ